MGSGDSKPSAPVLSGVPQIRNGIVSVKIKEDIILRCETNCRVDGKWKKGDAALWNGGRISITQLEDSKHFELKITGAMEEDEGQYTLEISNSQGQKESSVNIKVQDYNEDWRNVNWRKEEEKKLKKLLQEFKPRNPEIKQLRFLLHGPVGAGKSSLINSINSVFQGRINVNALVEAATDKSFTRTYKMYKIKDHQGRELPFVFNDIMGLENDKGGVLPDDIISAFKGHVSEGYEFNPTSPLTEGNHYYNSSPSENDKVHCLVSVIPADKISLLQDTDGVIKKMREIRQAASNLEITQVVIMTRVDECCPLVNEDLMQIYSSKKIKQAMQQCSNKLGVPMNCIFPIKNYDKENNVNVNMDCLILDALKNIVNFANDYVECSAIGPSKCSCKCCPGFR